MKDIKGYEGLYAVDIDGKVYSYSKYRHQGKFLKQHLRRNGYKEIGLSKNKIRKTFLVHRLIANAFIPNPNNHPEINHIDGNKANNNFDNLEWVTSSENQIHAIKNGLQKFTEKHRLATIKTGRLNGAKGKGKAKKGKLSNRHIIEIIKKSENGASARSLGREYSVDKGTIMSAIHGKALCYKRKSNE